MIAPDDGRVLGIHIPSPNAAEYVTEAALYIKYGKTLIDIVDTIHVLPTYSEALKPSAQAFPRPVEKISCCAE
ncbi:Mercuric reductase [archaeon HR01]|nr:Mercuric reductase [archaeon HR01]